MEIIGFNLLLADWGDEDHEESLLARKNSKWGADYLLNIKCAALFAVPRQQTYNDPPVKKSQF